MKRVIVPIAVLATGMVGAAALHNPGQTPAGPPGIRPHSTLKSHGCIRMRNSDAVALARMVMNHGGAPRPASWFQRVVNRVRSTQEVRLSQPVTVRVVA